MKMAVLSWTWTVVKGALNALAKMVVIVLLLLFILVGIGLFVGDGLPRNMVLVLDLREPLADKTAPSILALSEPNVSIMDAVFGLDAASRDDRVKGVFVRVGSGDLSVPQAEELRDALKRFKAADKFVIAHSQSFYSGGLGDYQVAAAADEIWMQPASAFFGSGAGSTTIFLKGLFDKIHAVPQIVQREEYKNAANIFMETDYTAAHREATTRVLQSWYDTALAEIMADRNIPRDTLVATLDESPSTVDYVRERRLITAIGYDDDASDAAKDRAGEGAELTSFAQYVNSTPTRARTGGPVLALVHAAGEIVEGDEEGSLTTGTVMIAGDSFAQAIREATRDDAVRAILLRVDSPGGSAIASDQILDALKKAKAAGKPIVVSMGSVAASGGYYISLAADRIVAQPGTLTGSIGVLWGKVAIGESLQQIGVNGRELAVGRNADFLSAMTPWDADGLAEVGAQADAIYTDFTRKVAEGRNMPLQRAQELARGRVWTGADARERGLVDELGGFWTAVEAARDLADIDADARVVFRDYPSAEGWFQRLSTLMESSSANLAAARGLNTLASAPPIQALLAALGDIPDRGVQMKAIGLPGR
jgi:protease-4